MYESRGTEGDRNKKRNMRESGRAALPASSIAGSVDDPGMQCVNWKRVKRMNLIAHSRREERAGPDTGAVGAKP